MNTSQISDYVSFYNTKANYILVCVDFILNILEKSLCQEILLPTYLPCNQYQVSGMVFGKVNDIWQILLNHIYCETVYFVLGFKPCVTEHKLYLQQPWNSVDQCRTQANL
jgi:hypothetical protein